MTNFFRTLSIFLTILLLTSPALSIIAVAGFMFIPNEKLAMLFLLIKKSSWRQEFKQLRCLSLVIAAFLGFLFFIQILSNSSGQIVASLNSIFIIISIPFYFSYFSSHTHLICKAIFYVAVLQMLVSLSQQYFMLTGSYELASMFNNYSYQANYQFPIGETGFWYRTSGLFKESSSYGVFQWLAVICAIKVGLFKHLLNKILIITIIIEVVMNGALTGYFFILGYLFVDLIQKCKYKNILFWTITSGICLIFSLTLLNIYGYFNLLELLPKIQGQFDFINNSYSDKPSRLSGMVKSIELSLNSDFVLWGSGFSWNSPTLDIYSLYIRAYGVSGFFVLLLFIFYVFRKTPWNYRVAVFLALSINGHLSMAINILLISMPQVMRKINQIAGDS
jgi:hypothetical protein